MPDPLAELRAERDRMIEEIDRASWQDYYLPGSFWARYWQVDREIKARERAATEAREER